MPKAQRTQGIEYFDSINTYRQVWAEASMSFELHVSNFSLVLFGKGRPWNTWNNFDKSMYYNKVEKSMY